MAIAGNLKVKVLVTESCLTLCDHMDCPSIGFSRQEYWSGLPTPSPGDLPDLGMEPGSPALQADSLPSKPPGKPQPYNITLIHHAEESNVE